MWDSALSSVLNYMLDFLAVGQVDSVTRCTLSSHSLLTGWRLSSGPIIRKGKKVDVSDGKNLPMISLSFSLASLIRRRFRCIATLRVVSVSGLSRNTRSASSMGSSLPRVTRSKSSVTFATLSIVLKAVVGSLGGCVVGAPVGKATLSRFLNDEPVLFWPGKCGRFFLGESAVGVGTDAVWVPFGTGVETVSGCVRAAGSPSVGRNAVGETHAGQP